MFDKKVSILICIESFFDGGAEMFAIRLANALESNYNVFFLELDTLATTDKKQLALLNTKSLKVFQPGNNKLGRFIYSSISNKLINRRIRQVLIRIYEKNKEQSIIEFMIANKIKVVNSHNWFCDHYFAKLKNRLHFKLVTSLHGHYEFLRERADYREVSALALEKVDKIVYLTQTHLNTLSSFSVNQSKLVKIFYGYEFDSNVLPTEYDGGILRLVMVARGIADKGWRQLLEAVNLLNKKYPGQIKLELIGDGPFMVEMREIYKDDAILFQGYRSDVSEAVKKAHVCLLPSYYVAESLPNSVIEYLAYGKPVISTDIGAIADMIVVNHEVAGHLLILKNGLPDVQELAMAIEAYLLHPPLVKQHSILAIAASSKFSMKHCAESYAQQFEFN